MAIKSRNELETYSYFFASKSVKKYLSSIPIIQFFIYKFQNPVSSERGKSYIKDEFTIDVYQITDDFYIRESFTHPKYRNQKNELIKFKYTDLPVTEISVEESRKIDPI